MPDPTQTNEFQDLANKDSYIHSFTLFGTTPQTDTNYGYIFTARSVALEIIGVSERHIAPASDAGAVTLDVLKVPSGSNIAAGTSILTSTFNLKSTANTTVYKEGKDLVLASVRRNGRILEPFDSIAIKSSGVLTDLENMCVTIYYKWANNGSYR